MVVAALCARWCEQSDGYPSLVVLPIPSNPTQQDVGSSRMHPMVQAERRQLLQLGYLSLVVLLAPLSPAQQDAGSSLMRPMAQAE
ncbi:hypothetical protein NDU88_003439 [Pleurodeles waltl]|uniref:Uncharacterized protein n=1 Tax=Pleurodeles waltl TaxID=8319 RepID=A0AAV7M5D4_PLEWA|nr:hypothetical protein NDU88_003439 [Pleurodeles waltl]